MRDDLLSCLTREIKEEAIEKYLVERRLIELQTETLEDQAKEVFALIPSTGRRFSQLASLMIDSEMLQALSSLLRIRHGSPWEEYLRDPALIDLSGHDLHGLTTGRKYRGIILEAYRRFHRFMQNYAVAYGNLAAECEAINRNIEHFQQNFSLIGLLSFLRSLDPCAREKAHFLGGNFTAKELNSVEQKLHIHRIHLEGMRIVPPMPVPEPELIRTPLKEMASSVWKRRPEEVKRLIRSIEKIGRAHV